MKITIREADPQRDYERVAEIINFYEPEPVTVAQLHDMDQQHFEGLIRHRFVAVNADGLVIGFANAGRAPWMKTGHFLVHVLVDPAHCRQGVGTALYESILAFTRDHHAASIETWVFDNLTDSLRFAEHRGFKIERHIFESTIDLHTFDLERFAGVVEAVEASGIRIFSLADVGDTREARQKLWEVNYATVLDMPDTRGEFPNFEEFEKIWETSAWFRPDGQLVAADGDKYIGLSAVGHYKESNSAYNLMTGVLPEYRGRNIALALKLASIRAAKSWGVDYIRTNNDSQNAPMLAINRKLGNVPQPGGYRMVRELSD